FKFLTSVMLLPVWILLIVLLKPTPPVMGWGLLLAIPALILAGIMRYVWQYALAVIAFWTTRVDAINQLYFTLDSFLAGRIVPLADRKSTRLNSSHSQISYAVFCLKKKKNTTT